MQRLLVLLVLMSFLWACKKKEQGAEKPRVIAHTSFIPEELSPVTLTTSEKIEIFQYVHAFMVREDLVSQELVPQVLTEVPVYDTVKGTYTLKINNKAQFDDGSQITATDIAFTLRANACGGILNEIKLNFENIDDIKVIDNETLELVVSEPNIEDVYLLNIYPIMQKTVYDSASVTDPFSFSHLKNNFDSIATQTLKQWCKRMNGSYYSTKKENIKGAGAYKLTTWDNDRIILKKKENHWTNGLNNWADKSISEEIILKLNTDLTAKTLDLKNRSVDVSSGFRSKELAEISLDTGITNHYEIITVPGFSTLLMAFNQKPELSKRTEIFKDKRVREALAYAIPIQKAMDKMSSGFATRITSFISPIKEEYNNDLKPYPFDLLKADSLLTSSGWIDIDSDGIREKTFNGKETKLEITFVFPSTPFHEALMNIFKESLEEIGVMVKFENGSDWREILFETRQFDMAFFQISNTSGPTYPLTMALTEGFNGGNNFAGYSSPIADSLIQRISLTFDAKKRKVLLYELQEWLHKELPYIYLTTGMEGLIVSKKFKEVKTSGIDPKILLNTLEKKTKSSESEN